MKKQQLPSPSGGTKECLNINTDAGLIAQNGAVNLYWQGDGNLVLRDQVTSNALWDSKTGGKATDLCFQGDGNLVWHNNGVAIGSTRSNPTGEAMVMQADCNLVIYAGGGIPLWSSGTSCP